MSKETEQKKKEIVPIPLLVLGILVFLCFLTTASLGLWMSYEANHFPSDSSEKAMKGLFILFVGTAIFLPLLYFLFMFVRVSNAETNVPQIPSRSAWIVLAFLSSILVLITSSLGIWMSADCHIWSSKKQKNTVETTFIVFLIMGLILPILYAFFYYPRTMCSPKRKKEPT